MILRRKLDSNFTAVPNEVIENQQLSIQARWLLIYLLSKPKDWIVRLNDIRNAGQIGRDKAQGLVNELVDACYIEKSRKRNEDGSFGDLEYLVYDQPYTENPSTDLPSTDNPSTDNPSTDSPSTVNPTHSNTIDILSTESSNTILAKANMAEEHLDARERLWKMIPSISSATGIPQVKLRPIVGRWLKTLDDNASMLCEIMQEAVEFRPADFVGFVGGCVKDRKNRENKKESWLELWK